MACKIDNGKQNTSAHKSGRDTCGCQSCLGICFFRFAHANVIESPLLACVICQRSLRYCYANRILILTDGKLLFFFTRTQFIAVRFYCEVCVDTSQWFRIVVRSDKLLYSLWKLRANHYRRPHRLTWSRSIAETKNR